MSTSRSPRRFLWVLVGLLLTVAMLRGGVQQHLLRWGISLYLGNTFQCRVAIGELQGGFLSGTVLKDTRFYYGNAATPLVTIDEIATELRVMGSRPAAPHCILRRPKIFFSEFIASLNDFSLPIMRPLVLLPGGRVWRQTTFSVLDGTVLQSANRQDNVLLKDLTGSLSPAGDVLEFSFGTAKSSATPNRLQLYGTLLTSNGSSDIDFSLDLARLEALNLFLRTFHILNGSASVKGKIRSSSMESAELTFQDVMVFFPNDERVLEKLGGRISVNDQYLAVHEFSAQSGTARFEINGDAKRVSLRPGQIDIKHFLAKVRIHSDTLSVRPIELGLDTSAKILYRHAQTMEELSWNGELLDSRCFIDGKLRFNDVIDTQFRGAYIPGQPFMLNYKILSMDFERIKTSWFGNKLGSLFQGVTVLGDGVAECWWERVLLTGLMDWNKNKIKYRLLWEDRQLKLQDVHLDKATTLLGILDVGDGENSELLFQFQDESLTRFARALNTGRKTSLTGKMTGTLGFRGNLLDPAIGGRLMLRDGTLRGIPYKEGKIHLEGKFPKIYLDDSEILMSKDIPVTLGGYIDLAQKDVFKNIVSERRPPMPESIMSPGTP